MSTTPWWLRSVGTGDAEQAVHAEHDRQTMQGDVVDDLVPGSVEERRVDGDDRTEAAHRHPGGAGDGVLLGDADVEEAVREVPDWNGSRPVGPAIAAVMATMRASASASLMTASANTFVLPVGTAFGGPTTGSNTGASWRCFSSSSSAGG